MSLSIEQIVGLSKRGFNEEQIKVVDNVIGGTTTVTDYDGVAEPKSTAIKRKRRRYSGYPKRGTITEKIIDIIANSKEPLACSDIIHKLSKKGISLHKSRVSGMLTSITKSKHYKYITRQRAFNRKTKMLSFHYSMDDKYKATYEAGDVASIIPRKAKPPHTIRGRRGIANIIKKMVEESPDGVTSVEVTERLNALGYGAKNTSVTAALVGLFRGVSNLRREKRTAANGRIMFHYYFKK